MATTEDRYTPYIQEALSNVRNSARKYVVTIWRPHQSRSTRRAFAYQPRRRQLCRMYVFCSEGLVITLLQFGNADASCIQIQGSAWPEKVRLRPNQPIRLRRPGRSVARTVYAIGPSRLSIWMVLGSLSIGASTLHTEDAAGLCKITETLSWRKIHVDISCGGRHVIQLELASCPNRAPSK